MEEDEEDEEMASQRGAGLASLQSVRFGAGTQREKDVLLDAAAARRLKKGIRVRGSWRCAALRSAALGGPGGGVYG